jgi:hypothetical protein
VLAGTDHCHATRFYPRDKRAAQAPHGWWRMVSARSLAVSNMFYVAALT